MQVRELKLSGGFGSLDAPIVHFGLADHTQINKLEVLWPTGQATVLERQLKANYHYTIERRSH